MNDLFDEVEELEQENTTDEGIEKKERIVKPDIIIQLTDTIRVVLMSDRKNLKLEVKSDTGDKEANELDDEGEMSEGKWKQRSYYGTRNWQGVLERAYSIAKEERLGKKAVNETEDLREAIHNTTAEIKKWAKQITDTLTINKIKL